MKSTPRALAVSILAKVDRKGAFAERELDEGLRSGKLEDPRDRRLLTEIVYGTLRMRGRLDWIIDSLYPPGSAALDADIRNTLRTGLYQLFFLDRVPEYAVVSEAVAIAKKTRMAAAALVNAVLRNAVRARREIAYPDPDGDPVGHLSVFHSHPRWLVERLIAVMGVPEATAFCKADNEIPPLTVRVNSLKADRRAVEEELRKLGLASRPTTLSPDGLDIHGNADALWKTACFREGRIQIQDEGSQLISHIAGPIPGDSVLDLCAGTGGKTHHLAQLMRNRGRIVACDISAEKIQALRENAARLGVSIVETRTADAASDALAGERFDRVLVDAPCSGLGTLRRNPEIRWRLTPERLRSLAELQGAILHAAADCVKPAGTLVYVTCSPLPEENEAVVLPFLKRYPEYRLSRPAAPAAAKLLCGDGFLRTLPHRHGTDGFFAACLARKG